MDSFPVVEFGDRGRDNSAKDLVSNIISVAKNKRIRKRDKSKSGSDSIEADMDSETYSSSVVSSSSIYQKEGTYNERNIDQEIAIRKNREASITSETVRLEASTSSSTLSTVHEKSSSSSSTKMSSTEVTSSSSSSSMQVVQQQMSSMTISSSSSTLQQQQPRKDSSTSVGGDESWSRDKEPVDVKHYRAYAPLVTDTVATENTKAVLREETRHDELNHHPSATNFHYQVM